MRPALLSLRSLVVGALVLGAGQAAGAQAGPATAAPVRKHPVVCAQGVRVYTDRAQLPAVRDTVVLPPSGPVRVTSPEEMEAAELALRERAGSVGATGILMTDEVTEEGGGQRLRRQVTGFFAPSDSAHAQAACKK